MSVISPVNVFNVSFDYSMNSSDMKRHYFLQVFTLFYIQVILWKIGFTSHIPIGKLPFYSDAPTLSIKALLHSLMLVRGP